MTSYLLAGPATEPVSLARAKAFLRIEDAAEDGLIAALIVAARIHAESVTGRAFIAQTWRLAIDGWPGDRVIKLPVSPLIALLEIRCHDRAGGVHQIDLDAVLPDARAVPARIILPAAVPGVPALRDRLGIEIDFSAGFGSEPEDLPADLVQAVLALVAYWYENRDAVRSQAVPDGFARLVSSYKRVRL